MNLFTSCGSGDYCLALTVSLLGRALRLQAQGLPALPYIINGACQLECCRLGGWSTSFSRLPLYAVPVVTTSGVSSIHGPDGCSE